jgi:hypothetical protein
MTATILVNDDLFCYPSEASLKSHCQSSSPIVIIWKQIKVHNSKLSQRLSEIRYKDSSDKFTLWFSENR